MRTLAILAIACCSTGCVSIPDTYAPPMQRVVQEESLLGSYVELADPNCRRHLVRGFFGPDPGVPWSWTGKRPELRFQLDSTNAWKFQMLLTVPENTFAARGPVRVSFFVNGRPLETVTYETGGQKLFEHAVPAEWLKTTEPAIVAAEIDKLWTPATGGEPLGFIVNRAGFVH